MYTTARNHKFVLRKPRSLGENFKPLPLQDNSLHDKNDSYIAQCGGLIEDVPWSYAVPKN